MSYQPNEPIGYQPEYSGLQNLRRSLRETLSLLSFEILVIFLVLVYAVIIFIDLTTAESWEDVDDPLCIAATTREISRNATLTVLCDKVEPRDWLYTLDLVFLSVFLVEISVRIFAFGSSFFFDVMQVIDMVVVTIAFILALIPEDVLTSVSFLSVLRVVRLFRLAVIINKLQRSREAAAMRSKRAMYKRLGAPVEKVLTFLSELRSRLPKARDQENIDWMMEVRPPPPPPAAAAHHRRRVCLRARPPADAPARSVLSRCFLPVLRLMRSDPIPVLRLLARLPHSAASLVRLTRPPRASASLVRLARVLGAGDRLGRAVRGGRV